MSFLRRFLRSAVLRRMRLPRDTARRAFSRHAGKVALAEHDGGAVSFEDLGARVFALADGLLKQGLVSGDRVAFSLRNSIRFVELRLACHEAGLVAVPLSPDLSREARSEAFDSTEPKLYVYDPEMVAEPPKGTARSICVPGTRKEEYESLLSVGAGPCGLGIDPNSPATINFTSGTTGKPRGVVSTHRAWAASLRMTAESSLLSVGENECFLHVIPLSTAGWGAVLPCLLGGISGILMPRWNARLALELIERKRITRTLLTPSQLLDCLDDSAVDWRDLSSLRAIICGTAPLHGAKAAEALSTFGPILHQGYGLAEVLPPLAILGPDEHDPLKFPLRVGRPVSDVSVRIVDAGGNEVKRGNTGLIEVKSPTQTTGYWRRADLNEQVFRDGFFRTGDEGFLDEEGLLNVSGRAFERLTGLDAHPRRLEEVAHSHPAVKEAALADAGAGAVLFFSTRRGFSVSSSEMEAYLTRCLGSDGWVGAVRVFGDLPRSVAGKLLRRKLGVLREAHVS